MSEIEKRELVTSYLQQVRKETQKIETAILGRLEVRRLRWLILKDKTKKLSFIEFVEISEYIDNLKEDRIIL